MYSVYEVNKMAVQYNKLWKLRIDKKIKPSAFSKMTGIATSIKAKKDRDEYVALSGLEQHDQDNGQTAEQLQNRDDENQSVHRGQPPTYRHAARMSSDFTDVYDSIVFSVFQGDFSKKSGLSGMEEKRRTAKSSHVNGTNVCILKAYVL